MNQVQYFIFQALSLNGSWNFATGEERPKQFEQRIEVPAAFETVAGEKFDGVGWYKRPLEVPAEWAGRQLFLRFDGAATHTTAWVNGQEVGTHLGAWTTFWLDATKAIKPGAPNELLVRVDEKVGHNTQGFLPIIQPHFGGLWQDVTLHAFAGPSLDDSRLLVSGDAATRTFKLELALRDGPGPQTCTTHIELLDPNGVSLSTRRIPMDPAGGVHMLGLQRLAAITPWTPGNPTRYTVKLRVVRGDPEEELDQRTVRFGYRTVGRDGTRFLLNGQPTQVRGVLHWGYEPPLLAPNPPEAVWRQELTDLKQLGFNLVKCCLWIPPRRFYEIADELGVLVWQEYPTWHPKFTQEHKDALLAEFDEFFHQDRNHACIVLRSLTCETGQGADVSILRNLYDRCHALIPNTLVIDDSSWISWSRVGDFYDDHPYGNNDTWVDKLRGFAKFIEEKGKKPLFLGEAITGDTWIDRKALLARIGDQKDPWWQPRCLPVQGPFEEWIVQRFGQATLDRFIPDSRDYVMANRKYQIETLRRELPDAGYVVSVLRDFTLARMGLYDDLGALKWGPAAWSWHRDDMVLLATAKDVRAFAAETNLTLPLLLAHASQRTDFGPVSLRVEGLAERFDQELNLKAQKPPGHVEPLSTVSLTAGPVEHPTRFELVAEARDPAGPRNRWPLWLVPPVSGRTPEGVRVVRALDQETLRFLTEGGAVLHLASRARRSLRCEHQQLYEGAPWAPYHPLFRTVPRQMLFELQAFDLMGPGVLPIGKLRDEVDPILGFWATHDVPEIRLSAFALETRVGKGRLLATSLGLDDETNAAARFVRDGFLDHLASGPPPRSALSARTLEDLQRVLDSTIVPLDAWRVVTDPKDEGRAGKWFAPDFDDQRGKVLKAGQHWESQGLAHYDGIAWYRITFEAPASWNQRTITGVFEGVDDSYDAWLNGEWLGKHGDPEKKVTVWLQRTTLDFSKAIRPGTNQLTLRVVDHAGAGGLWKPVFVTDGAVDQKSDLLN